MNKSWQAVVCKDYTQKKLVAGGGGGPVRAVPFTKKIVFLLPTRRENNDHLKKYPPKYSLKLPGNIP
jgi:hypothetical protein